VGVFKYWILADGVGPFSVESGVVFIVLGYYSDELVFLVFGLVGVRIVVFPCIAFHFN